MEHQRKIQDWVRNYVISSHSVLTWGWRADENHSRSDGQGNLLFKSYHLVHLMRCTLMFVDVPAVLRNRHKHTEVICNPTQIPQRTDAHTAINTHTFTTAWHHY